MEEAIEPIVIKVDDEELNIAIEKAKRLVGLLKEANAIEYSTITRALIERITSLQPPTPKFRTVEENNAFLYGYMRARIDIMGMLEE